LEVWNLQFAGTGPKRPPDNGVWAGSLDAYLLSKGFYLGNYGNLMFPADVGQSNTVEAYDFSGAPGLNIIGGGNAILADCVFTDGCELAFPMDANNNLGFDTTTQTVTINNCTFDVSTFFQGAGKLVFNHCRFTKQTQGIGGSGFQAPGEALMVFNWCYITGGGIAPAPGAHVELVQMVRPLAKFECNDTLIILDKEGQTTNAKWGSGWTGVWSVAGDQTFTNMICLGLPAIDANPANPNVSNCVVAYGSPATPVLTNCVMEPGQYGYSLNQSGEDPDAVYVGPYPGINGGGNRTFDNVALADDDFG
jgi:hypothetical protein